MIDHVERRFLSFFLAILMIISVVPVNAFAASSRIETGSIGEIGWGASIPTENSGSPDLGSVTVDGTSMTITAQAEASTDDCTNITSYNKTTTEVTFTNIGSTAAIISFDYNTNTVVEIDGTEYNVPGSYTSASIPVDGIVKVKFYSPESGSNKVGDTNTLELMNIKWTANVTRNMTVKTGTNGTVKVAGTAISANKTQSVAYADGLNVSAEAASGYKFLAWVDENGTVLATTASANIKPEYEGMIVSALFVPTSENGHWIGNKKIFTDFQQALDAAASGDKMVKLMDKATLSKSCTIPAGVTVLIPHNQALTAYGANPVAIARPDGTLAAPKAYSTLTLGSGVVLTVRGSLEAAAQHYVAHGGKFDGGRVIDYYGHIVTGSGSRIDVESGGKLYAWGYVTGSGSVNAKSGAAVYEKFQIADYRGGGITSIIVPSGVFPFNQYYVQNVEVPETIHAGASLICHAGIYGSEVVTSSIEFIGSNGMFNLGSGGKATKRYDAATDRLVIDVEGQVGLNGISLMGYDTANFILPINNNITVNVNSGITTINQDVLLQPGTEVNVAREAFLVLASGKKVYLMDSDNWGNYCFGATMRPIYWTVANGTTVKRKTLTDARINLDGTAVIQGQAYASTAGALIESTGKTGVMILMNNAPSSTINIKQSSATSAGLTGMTTNISVGAAILTNGDNTTVSTQSAAQYTTYVYDTILDKWVTTAINITPTLTYHANDGSETPATVTKTVDFQKTALNFKPLSFALEQNTFTRDGYTFAGWGYGPVAAAEAVAEDAADVTTEEPADETANEAAAAEVDVAAVEAAASVEEFAKTFQPGEMVTISANTTLYAIWEGNPFQVYVDGKLDGEQLIGTDLTEYLNELATKKPGFTLTTWKFYKDAEKTVEVELTDMKMPAHDLYVEGVWEVDKASSFVYVDGKEISEGYEEGADLNTLLGGLFNGKTVADFNFYKADGTNVTEEIRADGKMPAYALYAKTLYTATVVNPDGGDALATWKEEVGADLTGKVLPTVTAAEGKKFVGWYVDGNVNSPIPTTMPAVNFEIMAVFEDLPVYTATFKVEGATDVEYDADYENNWTITINENDPTKAYHKFTGWLGSDGQTYKKGDTITLTDNLTLTAQFKANEYTITFYENTGPNMDEIGSITAAYGSDISERLAEIQKVFEEKCPYATFRGWATSSGTTVNLEKMPGENMQVVASFNFNTYTITWVVDGQTIATKPVTYRNTISSAAPADPTKTGYTFLYWQDANGKQVNTSAAYDITGDSTYTAVFAINTYTITWIVEGVATTTTVEHGTVPSFTGNTDKATDDNGHYTFLGWHTVENAEATITLPAATGPATYYAVYKTTAHNYVETGRVNATCSKEGSVTKQCDIDNCTYTDTETLPIVDTEHKWSAASIQWADDGSSVTATRTCTYNNEHKETATLKGEITGEISKAPSCSATGNTTYTAVFNEEWAGTSTKEVIGNIPTTPHDYEVAGEYTWTGVESCSVVGDCKNCDATITANAAITSNTTEGNCQVEAKTTYTATFTETWAATQSKEVTGEKDMSKHTSENLTYTNNKDGKTHTVKHACCGTDVNTAAPHEYVNGKCICEAVQTFTVIWYADGEEVYCETVAYGENAPEKDVPAKTGHTGAWDHKGTNITADTEINAVYTKLAYKIVLDAGEHGSFANNQKTLTYNDAYGTELFLPLPTAEEGYKLTGWTVEGKSAELPTTMPAANWTYVAQWELLDVTVKFNEGETGELSGKYFDKVTAPKLEKEGQTFLGWTETADPNAEVKYAGGAEITLNNTVPATLYAKWQVNVYNITWDLDGGTVNGDLPATAKYGESVSIRQQTPRKNGATFDGWSSEDVTFDPWADSFSMPAKDITIKANWYLVPYDIQFLDADGAAIYENSLFYDDVIEADVVADPTKASTAQYDYNFSHWIVNGQKVTFPVTVTGPMTFEPVFTSVLRSYDITFVVDGAETKVTTNYGEKPVIAEPTKATDAEYAYTFAGWDPEVVAVTGEATYTATWTKTPVEHTITFKIDGEIFHQEKGGYGTDVDYSDMPSTDKIGYTFQWDMAEDKWPTTIPAEDIVIAGSYTPNTYTITFKGDFDTEKDDAFNEYTITKNYNAPITEDDIAALEEALPSITGWEILGWYYAEEVEVDGEMVWRHTTEYEIPETMPAKDVTVYADWEATVYDLIVKSSIDDAEIAYTFMYYEESYSDVDNFNYVNGFCYDPECDAETCNEKLWIEGYTFEGYKYADGTAMTFPIECWPAEHVTIIAQYQPIDYIITFMNGDEEVGTITAPYGSDISDQVAEIVVAKEGYQFNCWMANDKCVTLSTMPLNGMTVYADFTINTYNVNFFATQGDAAAHKTIQVEFGNILDVAALLAQVDAPEKEGHTFKGWDTDNVPATMPAEAVNIYGEWDVNSYTITADGEVYTFTYGAEVSIPEPTKEGHTFIGWNENVPATMPAENLELTAKWEKNTYTIAFDIEGYSSITAEYGADITWPEDPQKTGYTFQGWDSDDDGIADITNALTQMPAGGLNLKPVWATNTVYITFNVRGAENTQGFEYGADIDFPVVDDYYSDAEYNYVFNGWSDSPDGANLEITPVATEAKTYYALYEQNNPVTYNVKFVAADDADEVYFVGMYAWNEQVPEDVFEYPVKEGHSLSWSVDGEVVTFPYNMTTKDVTFVATWTLNTYSVSIDGGEPQYYAYDTALNIEEPTKEGHTFNGWLKDGAPYEIPATMPGENLVLTSDWTVNTYILTVSSNDAEGNYVESVLTVPYGAELSQYYLETPSYIYEGKLYEFDCWAVWTWENGKDETMVPYEGSTMPASDVTMYNTSTVTGWETDEDGNTTYYVKSEMVYFGVMETIDGAQYWFNAEGYIVKDITLIDGSYYAFDHETGKFLSNLTGIYTASNGDLYYVINGVAQKNYGLHQEVDANGHIHYYIFGCGLANCQEEGGCQGEYKAQKNNFHLVSETNGYPLPVGAYDTGDDCVLLHEDDTSLNGKCEVEGGLRYLIDGVPVHKGLFEENGSYYYARTRGWLVVGQKYWISANKLNGLTYNGELITAGVYEFDNEGRMIFVAEKNGFYYNEAEGAWYYYVDNKPSYEGLRYFDGTDGIGGTNGGAMGCTEGNPGYYYINTYGKVIAGRDYWPTKTNNTGIKNQTYTFDENGVMQNPVKIRNGIYAEGSKLYYYQDSKLVHAGMMVYSGDLHNADGTVTAGVYNEDYIYVNTKGELKIDCSYWTSKTNGLVPAMSYTFDEYGRMVDRPDNNDEEGMTKNGIVAENGSLYYYEDGVRTYAGVICIDGKYYYVRTSGELAHSRTYWPTKHNGLVKLQTYTFDENGVMQNPVVLSQ